MEINDQIDKKCLNLLEIMAGKIAHDYNNILTILIGNISLAKSGDSLDEETMDILTDIENATIKANKITQFLLTFSQINPSQFIEASLLDTVSRAAESVLAIKPGFRIFREDNLQSTRFNKPMFTHALEQLFIGIKNLLPNSTENPEISISLSNHQQDDSVKNYIKITIKIPFLELTEEKRLDIFHPNFSIKKEDFGMGPLVAFSVITKHGGHITVSNSNGTEFTILMPAAII